ncbi:MAG TPA: sulfite exporter TauE/SafE family protein, partial [Candidatus Udaeobacter sp.]|nr:sulfite exporter TauE/SafE family protein [Candidatus Udaeobacter sp.]
MVTTLLLVILGFVAGLLGALTGIGGGVLLTPILALHFGIPIRQAIGTSLVAVITTSAASSSVHLQRHTTDIRLGMTLELATALGAAVMAYLVGY